MLAGVLGLGFFGDGGYASLLSARNVKAALNLGAIFFPLFSNVGERLRRTLDITAIETIVGIVWRGLALSGQGAVAFVILFAGLFVEHFLSGRKVFQRGLS